MSNRIFRNLTNFTYCGIMVWKGTVITMTSNIDLQHMKKWLYRYTRQNSQYYECTCAHLTKADNSCGPDCVMNKDGHCEMNLKVYYVR